MIPSIRNRITQEISGQSVWAHSNSIAHGVSKGLKQEKSSRIPGQRSNYSQGASEPKKNQSTPRENCNQTTTKKITIISKPLKQPSQRAVTFGGFLMPNFSIAFRKIAKSVFSPAHEKLFTDLKDLRILSELNPEHNIAMSQFVQNFVKEVKTNPNFRSKMYFSPTEAKKLSGKHLITTPQRNIAHKLIKAISEPITAPVKWSYKKLFTNEFSRKHFNSLYKDAKEMAFHDKLVVDFEKYQGFKQFVIATENAFRKDMKIPSFKEGEELLIPDEKLKQAIRLRRFATVDGNKGQYSTKNLSVGNRVITGGLGSLFLGADAYNQTMRISGKKDSSEQEFKSRFWQQVARVGINAYLMGIVLGVFKKQIDRSMGAALAVMGGTVLVSEIAGRMLVGKPILPTSKEEIDRMEEELAHKKGIMASFGRLLTGSSYKEKIKKTNEKTSRALIQTFKGYKPLPKEFRKVAKDKISFNGNLYKTAKMVKKQELEHAMRLLDSINPAQGEYFRDLLTKGWNKIDAFKGKTYQEIMEMTDSFVTLGEKETLIGKTLHIIFAPYYWVKNGIKAMGKGLSSLQGKTVKTADVLAKSQQEVETRGLSKEFNMFVENRKAMSYWAKSTLSEEEKMVGALKEFIENQGGNLEKEINGVKNHLLYLMKLANSTKSKGQKISLKELAEDIAQNGDNPKYKDAIDAIRKNLNALSYKADSAGVTAYDSGKYTVSNMNISRLITTAFLITDAYNLTMQYSNNKTKSAKDATGRAIQETSRLGVSAYMLNMTRTAFRTIHNSNLYAAWFITASEYTATEILARKLVGMPITPKNNEQIKEIEKRKQESKNPIVKLLVKLIGKKQKPATIRCDVKA